MTRRPRRAMRARVARRKYARRVLRTRVLNPQPVFTETLANAAISSGAGGNFTVNMGLVPQFTYYSKLYRTFRILKLQVIIVPDANTNTDFLQVGGGSTSFRGLGRLAYAINDSPNVPAPASENDVLLDNGCKIRNLTKPIKISCTPQPKISVAGGAYINTARRNWLDMDTASSIDHTGISFWYSTTGGQINTANVYYKVTFALKDPR